MNKSNRLDASDVFMLVLLIFVSSITIAYINDSKLHTKLDAICEAVNCIQENENGEEALDGGDTPRSEGG